MKGSITSVAAIAIAGITMAAAFAPSTSAQAEPSCAELMGKYESEAKGYEDAAEKERAKALAMANKDPLLVIMEDGRIVDLSGEEALSKPLESWTNAQDTSIRARDALNRAREAADKNDEEGCSREIRSFRWNRV